MFKHNDLIECINALDVDNSRQLVQELSVLLNQQAFKEDEKVKALKDAITQKGENSQEAKAALTEYLNFDVVTGSDDPNEVWDRQERKNNKSIREAVDLFMKGAVDDFIDGLKLDKEDWEIYNDLSQYLETTNASGNQTLTTLKDAFAKGANNSQEIKKALKDYLEEEPLWTGLLDNKVAQKINNIVAAFFVSQQKRSINRLTSQDVEIAQQDVEIAQQDVEIAQQDVEIAQQDVEIAQQDVEIAQQDVEREIAQALHSYLMKNGASEFQSGKALLTKLSEAMAHNQSRSLNQQEWRMLNKKIENYQKDELLHPKKRTELVQKINELKRLKQQRHMENPKQQELPKTAKKVRWDVAEDAKSQPSSAQKQAGIAPLARAAQKRAGIVPQAAQKRAGVVPRAAQKRAGIVPQAAQKRAGVVPRAAQNKEQAADSAVLKYRQFVKSALLM